MSPAVKKLSRRLKSKRRALLLDYNDEDLHKLRITLRRIRSILKQHTDDEAARLRRELGRMADATNDARDWDTFYTRLRKTTKRTQFRHIQPFAEARRSRSHRRVRHMLRSKKWSRAVREWKQYARDANFESLHPSREPQDMGRGEQRLATAARRALSHDDDKSWHKLRIAVKELRYQLESATGDSPQPGSQAMLQQCKRLQAELGDWHDTVVHRGLLRALTADLDSETDNETREVLAKLSHEVEQEGAAILARVRATLRENADT